MRIEFDAEEAWTLMSYVIARMLDETPLPDEDRARIRRWRSEQMRPGDEAMRALTEKINRDVNQAAQVKQRSQLRRPDWR